LLGTRQGWAAAGRPRDRRAPARREAVWQAEPLSVPTPPRASNPASTGSIAPGIPQSRRLRSVHETGKFCISSKRRADHVSLTQQTPLRSLSTSKTADVRKMRKKVLATPSEYLSSFPMLFILNSQITASFRREPGISRAETSPNAGPKHRYRPLFPRNPLFPASGPATGSYNGIHRESNFLAAIHRESNFLAAMTPGATNLGSLRSRLRTPLRNAPLRAAPSATAAQIRVPRHSSLDPRSMISYPFPAPRHHSLV
jgi:hypothetical protein